MRTDYIWTDPAAAKQYKDWSMLIEETRQVIEMAVLRKHGGRWPPEADDEYRQVLELHTRPMRDAMVQLVQVYQVPVLTLGSDEASSKFA